MTDDSGNGASGPSAEALARATLLDVRAGDIAVALATTVFGAAVVWDGVNGALSFAATLVLGLGVMIIPAAFLIHRARRGGDLTILMLLTVATLAGGPIGAAGCTLLALGFCWRRPAPTRLSEWYDYISGVVERSQTTHIYEEVSAGRVPPDPTARVHRLAPVLSGTSIAEQQRVLGVVGRRYDSELRGVLKRALRHRNGLVRAQAAAIASQLDREEKAKLWANTPERVRDALETEARSHEASGA